eukprot:4595775-Pleurochrysis_carterae.AAC.2
MQEDSAHGLTALFSVSLRVRRAPCATEALISRVGSRTAPSFEEQCSRRAHQHVANERFALC